MKIVLTGGTGFIGTALVGRLIAAGHHVVLLTRRGPEVGIPSRQNLSVHQWDGVSVERVLQLMDGVDAVINLAGEPIAARRWSPAQKERIVGSRVNVTRALVRAMARLSRKPSVLVNASAVGFYGSRGGEDVTEATPPGSGFLSDTVASWEREAKAAEDLGIRIVLLRIGIVLGEGGGALARMVLPFRLFLGGPVGSGKQWFPWIHRDDVVGAVLFALETPALTGPANLSAPEALTMTDFCRALGRVMHRPSWLPVPGFMLRLLLGEMADMLLTGQKVSPEKLIRTGYAFVHPGIDGALRSILRQKA